MCGGVINQHHLKPVGMKERHNWRRRSADIGGLHLAMGNDGHGSGWMGDSGELKTQFAELLGDMYTSTLHAVHEHDLEFVPTDLPPDTRRRLIRSLEQWHFEPHKLPEEELLSCTLILFEALYRIEGMEETVGVSMEQVSPFVHHLRRIYRLENSYHNFEHALDVLQASYSYLRAAGMVPPLSILLEPGRMWKSERAFDSGPLVTSLNLHCLFVIYIAAIGHDAGHPGFTNLFMKNAGTPLSEVYDGKSALEQMHCQLLFCVMRCHGLGVVLDHPENGQYVRKLLWETVIATDMSVHDMFMERFQKATTGDIAPICHRQILMCQAILKCADISNPSRPYPVAKHWAAALMEEWSSQALLEKFMHLPTTVQSSDTPVNEASSQVFFITHFAKPLLDLVSQAVIEMKLFADHCTNNLRIWTKRRKGLELTQNERAYVASTTPRHPDEFMTAFPLTLPPVHRAPLVEEPSLVWPMAASSRSSESSSGSDSNLCSPSGSVSSFAFSPTSDSSTCYNSTSNGGRPPSNGDSASVLSTLTTAHAHAHGQTDAHAAIRAAGKLGIRKSKSNLNRNSWSPSAYTQTTVPRSRRRR
ncbi:putative phosphodiesterase [Lyophyllum shimeji]|uniref:Phosphodiesterase n=1 Tax=Lyophyllum shimeji TaxID=47721 RepID=A0A9P3PT28_LYOSH|nr:putative phosphodiesterase [Lyophyllum shimeji]